MRCARTARCLGPPSASGRSSSRTSIGPRIRNCMPRRYADGGGGEREPRTPRTGPPLDDMDLPDCVRPSRCLDLLRCRLLDDGGRGFGLLPCALRRGAAGVGLILSTMAGPLLGVLAGVLL